MFCQLWQSKKDDEQVWEKMFEKRISLCLIDDYGSATVLEKATLQKYARVPESKGVMNAIGLSWLET